MEGFAEKFKGFPSGEIKVFLIDAFAKNVGTEVKKIRKLAQGNRKYDTRVM